jgi:hypothetical protein
VREIESALRYESKVIARMARKESISANALIDLNARMSKIALIPVAE